MRLLAIVIAIIVAAACSAAPGGTSPPPTTMGTALTVTASPSRSAPTGTVTLSDTECHSDVPAALPVGPVELSLASTASLRTVVGLWRIPDDHTITELRERVDQELQLADAGKPLLGHPEYLVEGAFAELGPGETRSLTHATRAGAYAIICLRRDAAGLVPFDVLGPFRAT